MIAAPPEMESMKLALRDRSNYYKGLLILMGRDRIIDPREREHLLEAGRILGFERRFCEAAIGDLLRNKYLAQDPVTFSKRRIAECFIRDGILLSLIDSKVHPHELAWLRSFARANNIAEEWLAAEMQRCMETEHEASQPILAALRKCF